MSKKHVVIFVSFIFVLASGVVSVLGQDKSTKLENKLVTIHMVNKPLVTVFARLIYKYDVAIGLEESMLDSDHNHYDFETNVPPEDQKAKFAGDKEFPSGRSEFYEHLITVNYKDARLEDVMDDIVKQMKNYDWEINNDVVNIFPVKGQDPKFKKLLDLRIREFAVWKGAEVGIIQPIIVLELREFRSFLAENNLYAESDRSTFAFIKRPLPEGMRFSNLTLKELLNAITKSKRGGWILRTGENKKPENKDKKFIDILI